MARAAGAAGERHGPPANSREATLRKEVSRLKRVLAEKTLEVDFFKGALQKVEARRQRSGKLARRHLRPNPGRDVDARHLSIERMCQLAQVSRAGFYRSLQERTSRWKKTWKCGRRFSRSRVEHRRRYGYRRITAELRRRGMLVNHKRVARLMREDNLLAMQPRAFVVTTDSAA